MKRRLALILAAFAVAVPVVMAAAPAQAIIGGTSASVNYSPVASLQWTRNGVPNTHRCGATLIADIWAVTAAHCVSDGNSNQQPAELFHISIGNNDRTLGQHVGVSSIIRHPTYGFDVRGDWGADIALLKLEDKAPVRPALLGDEGRPGQHVTMVGWGRTVETDPASVTKYLQELGANVRQLSECQGVDEWDAVEGDLCVSTIDPTVTGVCNGDSGSPAINQVTLGVFEIYGVVSRGPGTGCLNGPEVYTSTAYYKDWILSMTGPIA